MKTKNIAHRGFSGKYPENTMLAFEKAVEMGADGIELDVQLTKDKEVVIFHDYTLERMTNSKGELKEYTLYELQALTLESGQWIPTLSEYLSWAASKDLFTLIELKSNGVKESGLEEKVLEEVERKQMQEQVLLSSEYDNELVKIKQLAPLIKCGLLVYPWNDSSLERAASIGVESVHPDVNDIIEETLTEVRNNGLETTLWTINDPEWMEWLVNLEADAIITDYPDRLQEMIEQKVKVNQ